MNPAIKVAVVGHTNTGKTSLLRTLTRDAGFGAIANRPSTTRHVEGAALLVEGQPVVEFYDTPGLEDSIGLLEHLETLTGGDWLMRLAHFLDSPDAHGRFAQEAKSLRQVIACDLVLYVIDCRERVLGKYRDELTILVRAGKPVIPLLNFVDSPGARSEAWHRQLLLAGLHASLTFNPLVIDSVAERKLFEKMRALRDELYEPLGRIITDLERQRTRLRRQAADQISDLLLDAAACTLPLPPPAATEQVRSDLIVAVSQRELDCARTLLTLFSFQVGDYQPQALLLEIAAADPLRNPAALKQYGLRGGSGAAAGAAAGLTLDLMLGGLSLGAGAGIGAGLGALLNLRRQGTRVLRHLRGQREIQLANAPLRLLAARQLALAGALLRRGHADPKPVSLDAAWLNAWEQRLPARLQQPLLTARIQPGWSRLTPGTRETATREREQARTTLATSLTALLEQPPEPTPTTGDETQ